MRTRKNWIVASKILLVTYVLTGIMLVFLAFLMYKMSPGSTVISGGLLFIYMFSTFIGGFLIGKRMEEKQFLWGILLGVAYFVGLLLISCLVKNTIDMEQNRIISGFFICTIGGMIGGMLS